MNSKKAIGAAALALMLIAGAASAQTTSTTSDPGVPNTGVGGLTTLNAIALATSGVIAAGGLYLMRRRAL